MKNTKNKRAKMRSILATLIALSMTACPTDAGGGGTGSPSGGPSTIPSSDAQKVTYGGVAEDGNAYTLEITKKQNTSRAAYSAQPGDTYVLTYFPKTGDKTTKTGTVNKVESGKIILNDTDSVIITVTISGQGMEQISGSITWDDTSTSVTISITLTPATSDFLIRDGELIKYLGSGGSVTIPNNVTIA